DIIVKSCNIRGYKAEYVPGWDCHGLPIELKVEHSLEEGKEKYSSLDIRKRCREYANKYLDIQREEFKRLGVLGEWENPYLTMDPSYEAATAKELCNFMHRGSVVRHKKPVFWCPSCQTALAEAEVEYQEQTSPSIYVSFPLDDPTFGDKFPEVQDKQVYIPIWTTTPWTIPSNMAIAVHPDFTYVLLRDGNCVYLVAEKLLQDCIQAFQIQEPQTLNRFEGKELENLIAKHPLYGRNSPIVLGDYVTLETGTGCVHTAPGHGQEDYETGLRYDLEIYAPVDADGRFTSGVDFFEGEHVFEANPLVISKLQELGLLLAQSEITHSYPHCWRCKKPVIFRATTQWFISMAKNDLRNNALQAIENQVEWIPSWGKQRIKNMIANRPDWCISRQRHWGVPIIALICQDCGEAYYDTDWMDGIVDRISSHPTGADYWFEAPLQEIVPPDLKCSSCGGDNWQKETDILDVWFDSGTSYAAVLEKRPECSFPADMYLEGSDQHRGWFHSSMLASIGTRDTAPYKSVLTHGFVVDGEGKKMSKSLGNVIAPFEIIEKYGAEILRMWVASENYQEDLRISEDILKQLVDIYRRIRNTCRYLLGNLSDFEYSRDCVQTSNMLPFDRYSLDMVLKKHQEIKKAYRQYEIHKAFHTLHNLCANELSSFYLDILKERLYVNSPDSRERRSAQTCLFYILNLLLQDMAPIFSFTAEEVYQYIPAELGRNSSTVFGINWWEPKEDIITQQEKELWDLLYTMRGEVSRAIEPYRKQGNLGHSLDAYIELFAEKDLYSRLQEVFDYLREFLIVSKVEIKQYEQAPAGSSQSGAIPGLCINVSPAPGDKCARCWNFSENLGTDSEYPDACPRCSEVLKKIYA
ncbi:MAG: isoleucine--tRNA ligase, partial [Thermodesulfobacteriota bacterium]